MNAGRIQPLASRVLLDDGGQAKGFFFPFPWTLLALRPSLVPLFLVSSSLPHALVVVVLLLSPVPSSDPRPGLLLCNDSICNNREMYIITGDEPNSIQFNSIFSKHEQAWGARAQTLANSAPALPFFPRVMLELWNEGDSGGRDSAFAFFPGPSLRPRCLCRSLSSSLVAFHSDVK